MTARSPASVEISDYWICRTCGANREPSGTAPADCPVCEDDRQWVPRDGHHWATREQLEAEGLRTVFRPVEESVVGIGVEPGLGVGHRGVLVRTGAGNLLWDPPGFLDRDAVAEVERLGGVAVVASSHPHMYGSAVEWADLFDAGIALPEADAHWLQRPSGRVRTWSGEHRPLPGVTIVQTGGHFPGSAVLHLDEGPGVLFTGDTIMVTPGGHHVTFLYSAPNRLPLPERLVRRVVASVDHLDFDRIHGGWWEPSIGSGAKELLARDAERYVRFLNGDLPAYD
ncbi:hypothetical protein A6A08_08455 [Nocardiopsis sp. TSRI0078]|uniref:hypothetical protein n=1 Tax=unclassified Nocardiopsis TaxID=2649073 RepID=UPI0009405E26|nr:hypothetical protein [Nocardiopsis sp. TSRI0078]OKI15601.1 hypothetical protein A6A08_08455 [Nocardiopsis sp. TSRI0078]